MWEKRVVYVTLLYLVLQIGWMVADGKEVNSLGSWKKPRAGYFENCGANVTEAYVKWRPPKLHFGDTMHISFHVIPPVFVDKGYLQVYAFDPDDPTETPVFHSDGTYNCADIHKYFLRKLCPFKKGVPVDIKNYKENVPPSFPLPTGSYIVKLILYDKKEAGRHELLCVKGLLVLLDD